MTDDITALRARDEELARLREESERRARRPGAPFANLLDPDYIRKLVLAHGLKTTEAVDLTDVATWAEERFKTRMARIVRNGVHLEPHERVGVACLMSTPIDEPPLDDIHRQRIEAMQAIRISKAPNLPPFTETQPLRVVRSALRARRAGKLEKGFVMLLGEIGVSKTSAGAHAIASVHDGAYVDAELLPGMWSSFDREHQIAMQRLRTASVAVIGEIRTSLIAEKRLGEMLSSLVEFRRGANRITIMDGNMKPKDFARAFTAQAVSRLRGQVEWVWTPGDDLRKRRV